VEEEPVLDIDFSSASLFDSILSGGDLNFEDVKIVEKKDEKSSPKKSETKTARPPPVTRTTTTTTTTTTTSPTTTTPRVTTPGVCGEYCRIAGTITIKSGLQWSYSLDYPETEEFSQTAAKLVYTLRNALEHSALIFESLRGLAVEAFSLRGSDILVDFNIELIQLLFDVSTLDLREALKKGLVAEPLPTSDETTDTENTDKEGMEKKMKYLLGEFEIDMDEIHFYVLSTAEPLTGNVEVEVFDFVLPDWVWVVIFGGVISVLIIALLGCTVGITRWKQNRLLQQRRYLSAQTLSEFKSLQSGVDTSELEINQSQDILFKKDKSEFWSTLQRNQEMAAYSRLSNVAKLKTLSNKQKVEEWQIKNQSRDGKKRHTSQGTISKNSQDTIINKYPKKQTESQVGAISFSSSDSDSGVEAKKKSQFAWSGSEREGAGANIQRSHIIRNANADQMNNAANRSEAKLLEDDDQEFMI